MNLCENWPPPPLDPLEHNHAPGEEFQFRWKSISGGWRRLKWIGMGTDCEKINAMVENAALATEHYNKARGFSFGSSDAMKSLASMWKALKAVDIPDPYMPPVCGLVNGVAALIELHAINRLHHLPPVTKDPEKLLQTVGRLCRVIERLQNQSGGWFSRLHKNTITNLGLVEIAFMEHGSRLPIAEIPAISVKDLAVVFRAASEIGQTISRPASYANMMLAAGYNCESAASSSYDFKRTIPLKASRAPKETVELICSSSPEVAAKEP